MKKRMLAGMMTLAMTLGTFGGMVGYAQETEEIHEVYTMTSELCFAGLINPYMKDRADVEKAWPKERASEDTVSIGMSAQSLASDFFVTLNSTIEEACEKYGYKLTLLNADGDTQKQSEHIDTFISTGVDLILIDPIDSTTPVNDINRAIEAGIPVIAIGTQPEDCGILTTICSDCFMNGFEAGKYAITCGAMAAEDPILATVIIGVMGSSTSESRVCGMIAGLLYSRMEQAGTPYECVEDAYLAGYDMFQTLKTTGKAENADTNFSILGMGIGEWTVEGGLAAAEDLCTASPDMNLIICENDFMAAGARKALASAGINDNVEIICASDGTVEGLEMIMNGDILCTGLGSPVEEGVFTVELIHAIFEEGADPSNLPGISPFNIGIINKENVEEYYEEGNSYYKVSEFTFPDTIPEIKAEYAG